MRNLFTPEQNHSLPSVSGCGYDESTTTLYGNRSRYTSGIFLPQICQHHGLTTPVIHSDFAVRATPRTKADCIRTNKGGCYKAVVEPLSHLSQGDKPFSLTKTLYSMNKPTQNRTIALSFITGVSMPNLNLQAQIGALWNTVSLLNLLSNVNPSSAKAGEFQNSLELIAKALADTTNQIQYLTEGENA